MAKDILWFITGGTIDAEAHGIEPPENVIPRVPSGIPAALASIGLADRCEFFEICHEDSKYVTTEHLDRILDIMEQHPDAKEIRISIGTDHLMQCQLYLERAMQVRGIKDKTVIMVAAMEPLANRPDKEGHAWENLRKSVESAGQYPSGFYVIGDENSTIQPVIYEDHVGRFVLSKDYATRQFIHGG